MADYKVTDTELTSIANAIRTKGGTQAQLEFPTGFVSAVHAIPTGGGGTSYFKRIDPIHVDITDGYASGQRWYYSPSDDNRSDVYTIEADKRYLVCYGQIVSNRMRCLAMQEDPATITGDRVGEQLDTFYDSNPFAYNVALKLNSGSIFVNSQDYEYLVIFKSNNGTTGIETYVFEVLF